MKRRARRAMTMIELVVATAIMGLLMAAVGSALVVAAKATPTDTSAERGAVQAASAVQDISRDLAQAVTITSASATGITFTVPDRTGDASPETISYAWNGVSGKPVTRTFNGATTNIVESAANFKLGYTTGSRTVTSATAPAEGSEQVLYACYDTSGSDFALDGSSIAVQYMRPVFDLATTSWRITRVNLWAKTDGLPTSTLRIQVYKSDSSGVISGSVLGTATKTELTMSSSYAWRTFTFGAMTLAPTDAAALVISNNSLTINLSLGALNFSLGGTASAGKIRFSKDSTTEDGVSVGLTTNGGSSWSSQYDDGLAIEVLGCSTAPGSTTSTVTTVDSVDITVAPASGTSCRGRAPTLARPGYASALPSP